ncbi:hypothetical protein Barb7_02187 [Bacteroidales bacterium Barb7]|nr:hypothetical protein Barb7_02187 [Bacteroidales bacterium Barb7]
MKFRRRDGTEEGALSCAACSFSINDSSVISAIYISSSSAIAICIASGKTVAFIMAFDRIMIPPCRP